MWAEYVVSHLPHAPLVSTRTKAIIAESGSLSQRRLERRSHAQTLQAATDAGSHARAGDQLDANLHGMGCKVRTGQIHAQLRRLFI